MKTPPFLLAAALLFWGWQTGHGIWSVGMAAALEGSRWAHRRFEFTELELKRIWLLCLALAAGSALILFSTEDRMLFIFRFTQDLPMSVLPLMLAQAYGSREKIPLAIFSWPLPTESGFSGAANLSYAYFALCVVGTSASTQANGFFFEGMTILILAALTLNRSRRTGRAAWAALLAAGVVGAYLSQQELRRLQGALEGALGGFIASMLHQPSDSRECRTAIGRSGDLPHSGRIIWRLTPDASSYAPPLLCQAVYQSYRDGTWSCSTTNDYSPAPHRGLEMFRLLPDKPVSFTAQLGGYYEDTTGPVGLPHGCFELSEVASPAQVLTNRLGCAELNNAPGLVNCRLHWGPGASLDPPPLPADRYVTETERPALDKVLAGLKISGLSERQRIRAIERFFNDGFHYTLAGNERRPSLAAFLTRTKAGHCEYFATATTLLLRRAGIPARYATGYAVPENARQGKTFVIRERDAHAWALAYHSDTHSWEEVDTTPSNWAAAPELAPPWWEPLSDLSSNLYFRFSQWRWSKMSLSQYAPWLMAPLILSLVWRIIAAQRGRMVTRGGQKDKDPVWPGLDSELYQIDRQLARVEMSRQPSETLALWQRRLEGSETLPNPARLNRIFELHRTLRFDPNGLSRPERQMLKDEAQRWLLDFSAQNPKSKTGRLFLPRRF